jgi:hypothetical protein
MNKFLVRRGINCRRRPATYQRGRPRQASVHAKWRETLVLQAVFLECQEMHRAHSQVILKVGVMFCRNWSCVPEIFILILLWCELNKPVAEQNDQIEAHCSLHRSSVTFSLEPRSGHGNKLILAGKGAASEVLSSLSATSGLLMCSGYREAHGRSGAARRWPGTVIDEQEWPQSHLSVWNLTEPNA